MPSRNQVSLRHSVLEPRTIPAVFVVTNLSDSGPGSLRQAVAGANANPGADSVQFQSGVTGTLYLTTGAIGIGDPVTVTGPGSMTSEALIVMSKSSNRLFDVSAETHLVGLSLANTTAAAEPFLGYGGAIASQAALSVSDCVFTNNGATNGGGAIYQIGPTLTVSRSRFTANGTTTLAGRGGAILASGAVSMQYCEFWGNTTTSIGSGGGAVNLTAGSLMLDSCSFVGNGTQDYRYTNGGAVLAKAPLTATNCTFAGNGANVGGALYLTAGGSLWNCTVANNKTATAGTSPGGAGGIYGFAGTVTLDSTIVSGNVAPPGNGPDIIGAVTAKNSCLGSPEGITFTDQGGNLPFGTNPQFSVSGTQVFGGLVSTTALLATSPCRDAGSNPAALLYDARGPGFPRVVGSGADMGAYEVQPPMKVTVQINDGSAQRSRVTRLTVTFDHPTLSTTSGITAAVQLRRVSDNAAVPLAIDGGAVFTPTSRIYPFRFTGGPLDNKSLADGVYRLTVSGTQITDETGQNVDGNGDGVGGDDYVSPTAPGDPNRIFRLFGDADGSGTVDALDFGAFRAAFGTPDTIFDFDGGGAVDALDFGQFRQRFGTSI